MGSGETAITILGGPRVINVFDGNEAPSGPNYLLFVGTDRLADVLWDGSGVGWSPTPHVPAWSSPESSGSKTLANHGLAHWSAKDLGRCILLWKRRRRRLPTSNIDPRRPQRDLGATNRQDSTDAPALVAPPASRHQEINFFGPQ